MLGPSISTLHLGLTHDPKHWERLVGLEHVTPRSAALLQLCLPLEVGPHFCWVPVGWGAMEADTNGVDAG